MKSYVYVFEECKMNRKFFSISSAAMILSAMSLASCESVHAGKNEMPMETVEADVSKFEKANPDFVSETLRTPDQLKRISKSGQEYSHKTLIVTLEDTVTPAQIDELALVNGHTCCVERNKNVGHNAATAINRPVQPLGIVFKRIGEVYFIFTSQFATVVAFEDVLLVMVLIIEVRALDATTRRRIIPGNCQAQLRHIGHNVERLLNQSLTKGASANNQATVPVLNSTRDDFGSGSRVLVHQNNQLSLREQATFGRLIVRRLGVKAFRVDNLLSFRTQELVNHIAGLHKITATISLQVDNEVLSATLLQHLH